MSLTTTGKIPSGLSSPTPRAAGLGLFQRGVGWAAIGLASLAIQGIEAQTARLPIDLHPGISSVGSRQAVDSDGDLTAAVWVDEAQLKVFCAVSDGRGTQWSAPLRVDSSPHFGSTFPVTFMDSTAVVVSGQNIYVSWRELDLAGGDGVVLFARSVDGGQSFGNEIVLSDGNGGFAKSPRSVMAVSPDPTGDHIYILRLDSSLQFFPLEPRVVASHNGGLTFGNAIPVTNTPLSGFTPRDIGLVADGLNVHVIWADDPNNPDSYELYYQRSVDGGLNWLDFDVLISRGFDQLSQESEARFAGSGDRLLATYVATSTVTGGDELRFSYSLDAGVTWVKGAAVSTATMGMDVKGPAPHIARNGNFIVAWEDDRSGSPEVFTSTFSTTSNGFSAPFSLWNSSGLGGAEVRIESPTVAGEPDTVLIAFDGGSAVFSGSGGLVPAALSHDGGLTFGVPLELDGIGDGDADYVELAYNDLYDNYLALWHAEGSGVDAVRCGGLRPQTATIVGATSGGTAQFDFSGFAPAANGSAKFVWALASDSPGSFPLPLMDGRDLGLAADSTFFNTLANPGIFSGVLDANGEGSSGAFDLTVPPGTVFYAAAVGISLGPISLDEITDTVPVIVQ